MEDDTVSVNNVEKYAEAATVDDQEVERMGYVAELHRPFTLLSVLAIGYEICSAPTALVISFSVIVGSGGPAMFIWGQWIIYLMAACVAVSLSELASAYPNAGGQYYWAAMLAPKSYRKLASFVVGYLSWASAMFMLASICISMGFLATGMYAVRHPTATISPWNVFVVYQICNILGFALSCWQKFLPRISQFLFSTMIAAAAIIFVTVLARAPVKQPASFVFASYTNYSGWNDGIAFLTGLLGVNWGFSCLDAVTHMAEEIPEPRKNVPKALLGTVALNAILAWPMGIALMICVQDLETVFAGATGIPAIDLLTQIFEGDTAGPIGVVAVIFLSTFGAVFGIQAWQARLCWSIARDDGMPFSKYLKRIAPAPYEIPFWAHLFSCSIVALLGCLYLGSSVAFNSFVGGGILMQYTAYSICIIFLLMKGRDKIPHGPFWLGKFGAVCNVVVLFWTVFTVVFYCFPPYYPVTLTTMNYVSVVLVGFVVIFIGYYIAFGRRAFTGPPEVEL
ncbi:hypothetical protein LTR10_022221 [Elasticomyces elasticus]|uniref:Amino acid permease/ SLC12A domain-containing protein n=1 Tax=Exophiala sideris TaxID=1016849 RepID=A0ABR0JIG6_9EURO|nr:hypothetical protein LTR10_022221 [Elasticomyces elasticus]KAK5034399.1 hypothetical protein LTS07_003320 [Exophiala sideris]KAK5042696.1 hypothetical protein LTR13_001544 [Exophiala sideris]KAK5065778.1 hypothetical protein LTR69_003328 [Exophiala sideris]KAK5185762.1 hypothetical protein LTR44_001811 [Eurotiomycetes sp. CCFEE 6388]